MTIYYYPSEDYLNHGIFDNAKKKLTSAVSKAKNSVSSNGKKVYSSIREQAQSQKGKVVYAPSSSVKYYAKVETKPGKFTYFYDKGQYANAIAQNTTKNVSTAANKVKQNVNNTISKSANLTKSMKDNIDKKITDKVMKVKEFAKSKQNKTYNATKDSTILTELKDKIKKMYENGDDISYDTYMNISDKMYKNIQQNKDNFINAARLSNSIGLTLFNSGKKAKKRTIDIDDVDSHPIKAISNMAKAGLFYPQKKITANFVYTDDNGDIKEGNITFEDDKKALKKAKGAFFSFAYEGTKYYAYDAISEKVDEFVSYHFDNKLGNYIVDSLYEARDKSEAKLEEKTDKMYEANIEYLKNSALIKSVKVISDLCNADPCDVYDVLYYDGTDDVFNDIFGVGIYSIEGDSIYDMNDAYSDYVYDILYEEWKKDKEIKKRIGLE